MSHEHLPYRPCVGIVLINAKGEIIIVEIKVARADLLGALAATVPSPRCQRTSISQPSIWPDSMFMTGW